MFCNVCGSAITDEQGTCPLCGKALVRAAHEREAYANPAARSVTEFVHHHPVASVVAALIVVFSVIAFVGSLLDSNPNDAATSGVTGQAPKSQSRQAVPVVKSDFPPLRFSSTRTLPTKLRWFQLGMSVADALSGDSQIENLGDSNVKPSPADANASLVDRLPEGYFVMLSFSRGRLIWISSEVGNISPEDANAFDQDTLRQLGTIHKPSVAVMR